MPRGGLGKQAVPRPRGLGGGVARAVPRPRGLWGRGSAESRGVWALVWQRAVLWGGGGLYAARGLRPSPDGGRRQSRIALLKRLTWLQMRWRRRCGRRSVKPNNWISPRAGLATSSTPSLRKLPELRATAF